MQIEYFLLIGSILILLSITFAKLLDNLGVPTLILFLGVGMIAGSDGIGGIVFTDASLAQNIGVIALVFILFAGGLETSWSSAKTMLKPALSLATIGVFITTIVFGFIAHLILDISLLSGLLLGAIISSTDAPAVFSVLRTRSIDLKKNLKPLLELESGSNDPMAVFLTIGLIQLNLNPESGISSLILSFFIQMGLGAIAGALLGKLMVIIINLIKVSYQGIYPVYSLAFVALTYSATALLGGSGFLAVYIAGIIIGNEGFVQKKTLTRFFDGFAWLSQIGMFLTLGLLVFPSKLIDISGIGLLLSAILMLVARPISVFISLIFSKYTFVDKLFISWVGLRGAVPIILATFPLLANVKHADLFFSLIFFIVLTSTLLQGWTLTSVAKLFGLAKPLSKLPPSPLEFAPVEGVNAEMMDFYIPANSKNVGKSLIDLELPKDSLVVLINRNENFIVPTGGTHIEEGDIVLTLVNKDNLEQLKKIFST